jgi:hypothetical protein
VAYLHLCLVVALLAAAGCDSQPIALTGAGGAGGIVSQMGASGTGAATPDAGAAVDGPGTTDSAGKADAESMASGGTDGGLASMDASGPCLCPSGLYVDISGDGELMHLTSADVSGLEAGLASHEEVAAQCLAVPIPWVFWLYGITPSWNRPVAINACAGPNATPPCVDLIYDLSGGSTYTDHTGKEFHGTAILVTTPPSTSSVYVPPLMAEIDGTFSLSLDDGLILSGSFRVCNLEGTSLP